MIIFFKACSKVEQLEKEVGTIKNPGTNLLQLILKYSLYYSPQTKDPEIDKEQTSFQFPKRKKRKTMPFS
ncbi:9508_t:CDS:2 [Dentiscutata erythropus]|uniref:9508_t:CDS:1 n=1 Tax=Dentiscutata erythropus TaxID=1348616 RepID=A0A9N9GW76_9GLOM|nr:9508_t:CDS:2 [Dentiscutata erythropus]